MSEVVGTSKRSITLYQLFGWVPLMITGAGATVVVIASVLRDI
jgi:hypothetical protein